MGNVIKIALSGNPNVGKSTVFNALTGLKQHTGNWTGKTVEVAMGEYEFKDTVYKVVDVPGTYSLTPHSKEECVARDFLCFSEYDKILIVCDATSLERNLYFIEQVKELEKEVVVAVNLLDEAKKKGIKIDLSLLSYELGVTVVGLEARNNVGIPELKEALSKNNKLKSKQMKYKKELEEATEFVYASIFKQDLKGISKRWLSLRLLDGDNEFYKSLNEFLGYDIREIEAVKDSIVNAYSYLNEKSIDSELFSEIIAENLHSEAEKIAGKVLMLCESEKECRDLKIDKFVIGKVTSYFVLILMLFSIFFITIVGANVPSEILMKAFSSLEGYIYNFLGNIGVNSLFNNMITFGGFRVLGWVVSVMLPPMAIFFPLFTILEDFGFLPRVAYVLDSKFQKANTSGKQSLTICMGYGCNCVGVTGARIIDSKRERLVAIITNSLTPCNGRFPAIIKLLSIFFIINLPVSSAVVSSFLLSLIIVISIAVTLLVSNLLSKTLLKGERSHYILELPPYRKPQFTKVIARSVIDRTLSVLGRAVVVAFPAGIIIWLLLNFFEKSIINNIISFFTPLGIAMGLDGEILTSFILGLPANEIVLPICLMLYSDTKELISIESKEVIGQILINNSWSIKTAISFILFSLFHFPCATTLITIYKETKSIKWLLVSFLLPTILGVLICLAFNTICEILSFFF
ncbi:MAG: ferrous iron transport protein B [Ruminococcaceae bacterium]|nr:ferrous iron transport protein B [Oscillospiraceae bacterium]